MTRPGPKPKPVALRIVEGDLAARRQHRSTAATSLPPVAPAEPSWPRLLPGDDARVRTDARRAWREVVPVLDRLGVLAELDATVLADYAVCVARLRQAERLIGELGLAVEGERGWQRNPGLIAAHQYRQQLRFYVAELGLAPSSRGRLSLPTGTDDGDDDLFGGAS